MKSYEFPAFMRVRAENQQEAEKLAEDHEMRWQEGRVTISLDDGEPIEEDEEN